MYWLQDINHTFAPKFEMYRSIFQMIVEKASLNTVDLA